MKYSCAVPFTSGSSMLKLWVDCVCPQMSVAKVESCWLQDNYPTVPQPWSHTFNLSSDKKILPVIVLLCLPNKRPLILQVLWMSWDLSEDMLPDIGPQGLFNILQHNCTTFLNESDANCAAITEFVQQDDVTVSEPLQHLNVPCGRLRYDVVRLLQD